MLLSYIELVEDIANAGVIVKDDGSPIDMENINGASIDITLGDEIMFEEVPAADSLATGRPTIDLKSKETLDMKKVAIPETGLLLKPNQFILASTYEKFFLPDNIVAEYVLKSSLARSGLQHLLAGYCDPCWQNSHLTLELKNVTQYNTLLLRPRMKIGQIKFYKVSHVPMEHSYAVKGQYNNSKGVTGSGGLR